MYQLFHICLLHFIITDRSLLYTAQGVDDLAADHDYNHGIVEEDLELPLFDLVTIATATKNFSLTNKIGEGGFGLVYKVIL